MDSTTDIGGKPFFSRIDWASFWTATVLSFIVYFLTLGPSVGLEDSGELAVAGDHLGVPHPPGYPIWSIISWCFARVFSFVTFRGQPNPAWAIALGSAVFGALAAGCTAMLITRSTADMLASVARPGGRDGAGAAPALDDSLLAWIGGVAGSLIFAFSPVMWSQSTIVEVYSLGAFFLMLVMLLTYRWMRRPSDKTLWLAAFVFGLGLTNYQVLLLSALPLVVIIFLRNIALFRDFVLVAIPFAMAAEILKLGSLNQQTDFPKRLPFGAETAIPSAPLAAAAVAALGLALVAMLAHSLHARRDSAGRRPRVAAWISGGLVMLSVFLLVLSGLAAEPGVVGSDNPANVALMEPMKYLRFATLLCGMLGAGAFAAAFGRGRRRDDPMLLWPMCVVGALFAIAIAMAAAIPTARLPANIDVLSVPTLGIQAYDFGFVAGLAVLAVLAATTRGGFLFAFPTAAIEAVLFILLRKGVLLGLTHPSTWWFCAPVFFNFALLALAAMALPNGLSVATTFLMGELGLSFYAYMPIVSDLRNPPMNWGYPRTWDGFKHAIMREQYEAIKPTNIFTPRFLNQLGDYFIDLRRQFTLLLAPFGFLPFAAWRFRRPATRPRHDGTTATPNAVGCPVDARKSKCAPLAGAFLLLLLAAVLWGADSFVDDATIGDGAAMAFKCAAALALVSAMALALAAGARPLFIACVFILASVLFVVLGNIPAIERNFDASRIDKLFVGGLLLLGGFGGLVSLFAQFGKAVRRALAEGPDGRRETSELVTTCGTIFALAGFSVFMAAKTIQAATGLALSFAVVAIAIAIVGGVAFALGAIVKRHLAEPALDDISQQWIIGVFCNFMVMSVVLIMLANPKGDLQDTFIQKVKFIASHGLFALWIGYGLVFALKELERILIPAPPSCGAPDASDFKRVPGARVILACAALLVLATPLVPIEQNYFNERLVFELSGAEQNGHDYGWQFGNYQLRGANAIREELEDGEEPLPNPLYPPEMGPGAVFFGGTDPGRFVPTYMIYSADVRPDVFLITQNALADNTFMSVTRDLYGDDLWIPTPKDSEDAFSEFVQDVRSGKRQANSDIVVENGRVQVVGALGVMEINGILCKKIFERNNRWHDFFVEESYVIPWMYPYLSPHGLIMKINRDRTPISQRMVEDDMDFWDWYVRRMTRDGRYRRDIVAQKSFSKLRSAIAGLYFNRGRTADAERAYNDARVLYPVSPEATFRYVQDILMRQRRYQEALEAVEFFSRMDPNNDRGPYVAGIVRQMEESERRLAELIARRRPGEDQNAADAFETAEILLRLGNVHSAHETLQPIVERRGLSVADCLRLADLLDEIGDGMGAARAMDRIWTKSSVRRNPRALALAISIYRRSGDMDKLSELLPLHLQMNPRDWQGWLTLSTVRAGSGRNDDAADAMEKAIEAGGDAVLPTIEKSGVLATVFNHMLQRRRSRQNTAPARTTPWTMPRHGQLK